MELLPAAVIEQVRAGKGGRRVVVDADVASIVRQVKEIDSNLSVHWNDNGEYFYVNELCKDGKERLVTTCNELDYRLLEKLRMIGQESYNVGLELERAEQARDRRIDYQFHENVGEKGERLAHAVRKDLNPGKIFIPRYW